QNRRMQVMRNAADRIRHLDELAMNESALTLHTRIACRDLPAEIGDPQVHRRELLIHVIVQLECEMPSLIFSRLHEARGKGTDFFLALAEKTSLLRAPDFASTDNRRESDERSESRHFPAEAMYGRVHFGEVDLTDQVP